MTKKLKRSQTNRKITGVCGGIAEYLNIDATIIRIIFVIATIVGFGSPVLIYLILMFIMPDEY
ncbi:PspC domain-containing protein [Rhodocytophaga rosea]|uniref:PspC domain-containing protein n=1 Tax=Rhodocytophaga rosea TaxID=2704465 RepID=A0A6C0GGY1_9BACT|nr:PspC domain-containing protein [Rhodocytophaga rosea]QHT67084.1 PspC domain-containing protein [Rhodocytophaga rosea]